MPQIVIAISIVGVVLLLTLAIGVSVSCWILLSQVVLSGFIAPEYAFRGFLSGKNGVFSFGVLLLEIMSKGS